MDIICLFCFLVFWGLSYSCEFQNSLITKSIQVVRYIGLSVCIIMVPYLADGNTFKEYGFLYSYGDYLDNEFILLLLPLIIVVFFASRAIGRKVALDSDYSRIFCILSLIALIGIFLGLNIAPALSY